MSGRDDPALQPPPRDHRLGDLLTLWNAAQSDTGQAGVVARFLLGLYNGQRFRFDLTDLRRLDGRLFIACLNVLSLDWTPAVEVHVHLARVTGLAHMGARFELLAHDWSMPNCCTDECAQKMRAGLRAGAEASS